MAERKNKFYVDEDIPCEVVKYIRDKLHWDIIYVCEEKDLQGKEDLYHHRKARDEKRILLTRDKDYLDPCRFPFHKSAGIIIIEEKNTDKMIYILSVLSPLLQKTLKEKSHPLCFIKIIASVCGFRLRYQETGGEIKERFYPWGENSFNMC
ncbi:DUF5615 family PIN-like protein [Candidatus Aerophobetes bacterium]|nr:DUF5615 family PIN-like protein [Candidatus Aerophobetes bacterium]